MIRDAHNKLLAFLCLILVTGGMVTAGVAGARPDSTPPRSTVALTEAFDRIVPGMTQADDLAAMGFDAASGPAPTPASKAASAPNCTAPVLCFPRTPRAGLRCW